MTPDLEINAESTARGQLRRIVVRLEELRLQLLGLQATLPEPAAERERLADLEILDAGAEIRAAIGCVLADRIGPALRDLAILGADPLESES
jgi:hypothetical protein